MARTAIRFRPCGLLRRGGWPATCRKRGAGRGGQTPPATADCVTARLRRRLACDRRPSGCRADPPQRPVAWTPSVARDRSCRARGRLNAFPKERPSTASRFAELGSAPRFITRFAASPRAAADCAHRDPGAGRRPPNERSARPPSQKAPIPGAASQAESRSTTYDPWKETAGPSASAICTAQSSLDRPLLPNSSAKNAS